MVGRWKSFDFVEVGTSDFRTLVQFLAGTDTVFHGARIANLEPR